ncbi:MAG: hypothetical protein AAGJ81_08705 [Verrucomicrobiota bacterium]
MTSLLRTSLLFFLPVFGGLILYQYYISDQPTVEEQKVLLKETHADLLNRAKESAETWLLEGENGENRMPANLESEGLILAEVIQETQPVVSALSSTLFENVWSLYPETIRVPAHISKFRFSIGSGPDINETMAILLEETIYYPNGDPARLNVFLRWDASFNYD